MAPIIKDVKVKLSVDGNKTKIIKSELKGVREEAQKTSTGFANLSSIIKKIGAGFAVGAIISGISSIARAGIDAQESFSKFGTVFKDNINAANKALRELQQNYGQSEKAGRDLLSNTGDLLSGFGFSSDAALKLSLQTQKLAVDLASFTNFSGGAQGASEALTKALLGEREQIKSLGISIDEALLKERLLAEGKDKLTGIALKQARAEATLQLAYEQSKNAIGDFGRTQNDAANIIRRTQAAIEDIIVAIGSKFTSSIGGAGKVFLSFLDSIKEFLGLDTVSKIQAEAAEVDTLIRTITALNEGDKTRLSLIKDLKAVYPELLGDINLEKVSNEDLNAILGKVNKSYQERIRLAQTEKLVAEERARAAEQEFKRQENFIKLQKELSALGIPDFLKSRGLESGLKILSELGRRRDAFGQPIAPQGVSGRDINVLRRGTGTGQINQKVFDIASKIRVATKLRDESLSRIISKQKILADISNQESLLTEAVRKETEERFKTEKSIVSEKENQRKLYQSIGDAIQRNVKEIEKQKEVNTAVTDIILNGIDNIKKYPSIQKENYINQSAMLYREMSKK